MSFIERILRRRRPEPGLAAQIEAATPAVAPMTIREAIEAMKVIAPYTRGLYLERTALGLIRVLWSRIGDDQPANLLRLLALMEHKEVEEIAAEYEASKNTPLFILRFAKGLERNPLDLLSNAAYQLGLTGQGWKNG